jgi:hypothetical protein
MKRASSKKGTNRSAWSVKSAEGNRTVASRSKVNQAAQTISQRSISTKKSSK